MEFPNLLEGFSPYCYVTFVRNGNVTRMPIAAEEYMRLSTDKLPCFHPKVGLGVLLLNSQKELLLGKRKNTHGAGEWSLPGGHLEWMESFETCCAREVLEETGLVIDNVQPLTFANNPFPENNKHYITMFFVAQVTGGELKNCEPEKCEGWEWHSLDNLPSPLFGQIPSAVEAFRKLK
jgi:8-oxo-dGTP diphosphatase